MDRNRQAKEGRHLGLGMAMLVGGYGGGAEGQLLGLGNLEMEAGALSAVELPPRRKLRE